jgi:predicted acetyltransferase
MTDTTPGPSVRLLRDDELQEGARLVATTMLGSVLDEVTERWARIWAGETSHGAFSPTGELAGVARWFGADLSMAGPSLPAACVTAVAVAPTHRRRGHLRRLMLEQLESVRTAGVPIALLVAAEWGIYGRFGYGPAVDACGYEIDAVTARFREPPTGSIDLVTPAELRPHLEAVHDARWARTMGAVTRVSTVWDRIAGVDRWPGDDDDAGKVRGAIWRDDEGQVRGAVAYTVTDTWTRNRPTGRIDAKLLVGDTPEAERELWRHLCDSDWVATVAAGGRAIDDPLPWFLEDGRTAVQLDRFDCIWARVVDVPRVLEARRAPLPGAVVLDVVDDLGYASGRWSVELGPDGAQVSPTTGSPDVRLPVGVLGALCLGGTPATRLHAAGWFDEERPGAVAHLDALLTSPVAPWAPTTF